MKALRFEWDIKKNSLNISKHGISFDEANSVFYDDNARLINDERHSKDEERFIILGMSFTAKILIVCHCYREKDTLIRIISARKATKKEEKYYWEHSV